MLSVTLTLSLDGSLPIICIFIWYPSDRWGKKKSIQDSEMNICFYQVTPIRLDSWNYEMGKNESVPIYFVTISILFLSSVR